MSSMTATSEAGRTFWVCEDCYLTHAGYSQDELGYKPERESLNRIDDAAEVTAGLQADEHDGSCPVWLGDANRADVPVREAECECERQSFSWAACDGCGSVLGGSREALTVWGER